MLPTPKTPSFTAMIEGMKPIVYFSMTKADEKSLLYATQVDNIANRIGVIAEIVEKCTRGVINPKTAPRWLTEYMFLLIRAQSIDSTVSVNLTSETGIKSMDIDLSTLKIIKTETKFVTLQNLTEFFDADMILEMREPTIWDYAIDAQDASHKDTEFVANTITSMHVEDAVVNPAEIDRSELLAWIDLLPSKAYEQIADNLRNINKVECVMNFDGEEGPIANILDFFILRRSSRTQA